MLLVDAEQLLPWFGAGQDCMKDSASPLMPLTASSVVPYLAALRSDVAVREGKGWTEKGNWRVAAGWRRRLHELRPWGGAPPCTNPRLADCLGEQYSCFGEGEGAY